MSLPTVVIVALLIFAIAVVYSSVGHAGGTAYVAVLTLFGLNSEVVKPTALLLNLMVASLTTVRFVRAGRVRWRLLWPFAMTSAPLAFLGGGIMLPKDYYELLLSVLLLWASARMVFRSRSFTGVYTPPRIPVAMAVGAAVGLIAGLTGIGGGVLLSPLLLFARWADPPQAAGVSAPFILVNSATGLLGHQLAAYHVPPEAAWWAIAAVAGALVGSWLSTKRLNNVWLLRILASVLLIAAMKMLLV